MNKRVTVRQRKQTNKQTSDERKDRDTSQIRRPLDLDLELCIYTWT